MPRKYFIRLIDLCQTHESYFILDIKIVVISYAIFFLTFWIFISEKIIYSQNWHPNLSLFTLTQQMGGRDMCSSIITMRKPFPNDFHFNIDFLMTLADWNDCELTLKTLELTKSRDIYMLRNRLSKKAKPHVFIGSLSSGCVL